LADLRARIIITSDDRSRPGFNSAREGLSQIERQITQARNALLGLFGISVGSGLVKSLIQTSDEFKQLNAAIKLSTRSEQEFNRAQQELLNISQRTSTGLRENVDLFRRVSTSVRDMGGDQERAFRLIELIDKSVALSGVSAQTAAAGIQQFNQGLGSGVLRGEEFNSVMENTPRLAQALADGMQSTKGELRSMAEQGKLTSEVVLGALESQAAALDTEFRQVPQTVGAALARVENAWTVFLGRLNEESSATASIAGAFNRLADNMQQAVETGLTLAKVMAGIWAAKTISSITTASAAIIETAIAQRQAAASSQLLMQQEIRRAEVSVASSLNLIREAQLQRSLAATEAQRVAAMKALDAAYARHEANVAALQARQAALNATLRQGSINALLFGDAVGALSKSMALLNRAFTAFIAFEIGTVVGEWLRQFDKIRLAGSYVAESFTLVATGFQAMFKGLSMQERFDQVKRIHEEFNTIRAADTESARAAAQSAVQADEAKAKAAEAASLKQKASFEQAIKAAEELIKMNDEIYQRNVDALDRAEQQKLLIIEASNQSQASKQRQLFQVGMTFNRDKLTAAQKLANDSLKIVQDVFGKEIALAKSKGKATADLDKQYQEARKGILTELEKSYAQSIGYLISLEQKHRDAAVGFADEILGIEQRRQQNLRALDEIGLSDEEKLAGKRQQLAQDTARVKELIDQGEFDKAKELSEQTEQLAFDVAKADKEAAAAGIGLNFDATASRDKYNEAVNLTKQITEQLAAQETARAEQVKAQATEQVNALGGVQQQLAAINDAIKSASNLTIQTDSSSVQNAIDLINKIPSEKIITIKTVSEDQATNSSAPVPGSGDAGTIPGFKTGVRLPGFGGGDKILSLLEAGEGVLNKNALRALDKSFGTSFFDQLNSGANPLTLIPGIAHGASGAASAKSLSLGSLSLKASVPNLSLPSPASLGAISSGSAKASGPSSTVNITLPGAGSFGPFTGPADQAESLAKALRREVIKRGSRR
jgi:tape measure domain-containing protein